MKATGLFVATLTIVFMACTLYAGDRMVLGELFTNTACPYDSAANVELDSVLANHIDELAVIRYHTWWPDTSDPFYQANEEENIARSYYYENSYVPHLFLDGIMDCDGNPLEWEDSVSTRAIVESPLEIYLDGYYDDADRTGEMCAIFIGTAPITQTDLYARFVLTESNIYYEAPNGLLWHQQVMRDMIPDYTGLPITIDEGDTVEVCLPFKVESEWYDMECQIVAFVQSDDTREVLQAAKWNIPVITVLALPDSTVIHRGGKLTYFASVTNNSDQTQYFDVWGEVYMPNGKPYPGNPVVGPKAVRLSPGKTVGKQVKHPIPGNAPLGILTYKLIAGIYPDQMIDESIFQFEIVP